MATDKALLPFRGATLVQHVASAVLAATGSVTLVGEPQRYLHLGYPVVPDRVPGAGPLGGIASALAATTAEWNLVLACDMPEVSVHFLEQLLAAAEASSAD